MRLQLNRMVAVVLAFSAPLATAADGDLDATFGVSGKVQIAAPHGGSAATSFDFTATDLAIQPDGKIVVVGYETFTYSDNSQLEEWNILRLNVDGSLDTTFGTGGMVTTSSGPPPTRPQSVVLRADGRIVVGGSLMNLGEHALVEQFTSSGFDDSAFGTDGFIIIEPANGDSTSISRLLLDSDGSIDIAGTYYDNQGGFNGNQFLFDRIAADGSGDEPFRYEFGSGANQDDHALDLAIDGQGRYVVAGYHRGAGGNYDFAAIRIRHDLSDIDPTFGNSGQTTVAFDLGGDDGDFCNAIAIFPSSGNIVLGGHATANAGSGTYQAAALAELDNNGNLYQYFSSGITYPAKFSFAYNLNPNSGQINDITKLLIDGYDTKYPQLLAIGSGNQYAAPPGEYFGIARLNPSASYANFNLDTTLNGKGVEGVYFAERPTGLGNFTTTNYGLSGAFSNGKLLVAGYTQPVGGNQIALTRLAAFDGIFKNGYDNPAY
jgi:uncharacterized delta-60 repeat protein